MQFLLVLLIQELFLEGDICDIRQENFPCSKSFEPPLQMIVGDGIGLHGLCHPPVRIRLSYRADQAVFMHQAADLLMIHPDPDMEEAHVDPHDSFGISPEIVGLPDQSEV